MPEPDSTGSEYFFKACRKGDATPKAVTVGESAVRVLADASEITGLPRDNFEVWEITREEFDRCEKWNQSVTDLDRHLDGLLFVAKTTLLGLHF